MAPKSKAASLTGSLLAPKGSAEPASPSQKSGDGSADASSTASAEVVTHIGVAPQEGEESPSGGIQFPLRLDPAEHLELRLAAARSGMSCQEIIAAALARYLADIAMESDGAGAPRPGGPE